MKRFARYRMLGAAVASAVVCGWAWAIAPLPTPREMRLTGGDRAVCEPTVARDGALGAEAYRLSVRPEGISIVAGGEAGEFYARQTLRQLAAPGGQRVPCVEVADEPLLALRGFMHDTGRNFQTVESLKAQLDLFALYKLNVFHWHLTDRPAWRIESRVYPQITSAPGRQPTRDPEDTYTFAQIREVIAYAKARHIQIIPELDMPGHSDFFKPVFGCKMEDPEGIEILKKLITEFCEEIPAADCPILHIGSDEVRIADPKGFMAAIEEHVRALGRTPMVWAPGLAPTHDETVLQYWSEDPSRLAPVRGKHPVVDSSGGYINLHDPQQIVLSQFMHAFPERTMGAILCCWPDANVDDREGMFRHNPVWPALLAFAEAAWHGPGGEAELAALEPTLAAHRDAFFAGRPFDYISNMRHGWRLEVQPGGEVRQLRGSAFLFSTRGAKVMLRPKVGTVAELKASFTLPEARTVWLRVGFDSPGRSNRYAGGIPPVGKFDGNGGEVLLDGRPVQAPVCKTPGGRRYTFDTWFHPANEIAFEDEEFWWLREPVALQLPAGTHTVTLRAPIALPKQYWAVACLPVRRQGERWVDDETVTFRPEE